MVTIYRRTSWGYEIHRGGAQVGAGVGFAVPYGVVLPPMWARIWRNRGLYRA